MSEEKENGPDVNSVKDNPKEDTVNNKEETLQDKEDAAKDNELSEDGEPDKQVENEESSLNEATELENKIIRQIEYYFGDINLPRDKFLLEQTKKDEGWVPLETMLTFKRLASMTTDPDAIVTALTKSSNNLMEVSEDRNKIRRAPDKPFPEFNEARRNELMTRTVYVKGFPAKGINLDILIPFFSNFGSVENVQMRTYLDKAAKKSVFKGSVFVIFKTKELAEEFLARESVKFRDRDLIMKWQSVYFEDKKKERKEREAKRKSQRNVAKNESAKNDSVKLQHDVSKGSIIKLKGFSGEVTREAIKKQLTELEANVAFIEFVKGDSEGWVRLHGENSAQPILDKLKDKPLVVCGSEIEAQLMEGEDEEVLLEKTREVLEKIRDRKANKGRRGKGRGGRGRGGSRDGRDNQGDRKRKGSPTTEEEPPAKVEAVEATEAAEAD